MHSLESQLQSLADAAEAATQPIVFRRPVSNRSWNRYVLATAACALALVGVVLFVARTESHRVETSELGGVDTAIADPLAIDLGELALNSERGRVSALGALLTFDFAALPQEWNVEQVFAGTVDGSDGASYWQMVEVVMPEGIHLVVSVEGHLDGSEIELWPLDYAEKTEVRGQPAQTTISSIEWIEQGIARARISGSALRAIDDELATLTDALEPIKDRLSWSQRIEPGRPVDDKTVPILAGELGDLEWTIIPTGIGPDLLALVIDGTDQGRTPYRLPANPAVVEIEIIGLPGGMLVFGHAPSEATDLVLHTESGAASVPMAVRPSGRNAFAVPLEDAIDPLRLEFLDAEGKSLGTFLLDQYPAYLIGDIGTGLELTIE